MAWACHGYVSEQSRRTTSRRLVSAAGRSRHRWAGPVAVSDRASWRPSSSLPGSHSGWGGTRGLPTGAPGRRPGWTGGPEAGCDGVRGAPALERHCALCAWYGPCVRHAGRSAGRCSPRHGAGHSGSARQLVRDSSDACGRDTRVLRGSTVSVSQAILPPRGGPNRLEEEKSIPSLSC
jgi:hypothetical protein